MFIGHFALGFAAKPAAPRVSLAILFTAAQLADVMWPFLVAAGFEQVRIVPGITAFTPLDFVSYPYSHSLVMLIAWGLVFGYICKTIGRTNTTAFMLIAALVVSHWLLDVISHVPTCRSIRAGRRSAERSSPSRLYWEFSTPATSRAGLRRRSPPSGLRASPVSC